MSKRKLAASSRGLLRPLSSLRKEAKAHLPREAHPHPHPPWYWPAGQVHDAASLATSFSSTAPSAPQGSVLVDQALLGFPELLGLEPGANPGRKLQCQAGHHPAQHPSSGCPWGDMGQQVRPISLEHQGLGEGGGLSRPAFDCLVPQATGSPFHPDPATVSQADHRKTANALRFSDL